MPPFLVLPTKREDRVVASSDTSEAVGGVLLLIFLAVVGYWIFSEDDIEDVSQDFIEAALDGDADDMSELTPVYVDLGSRFNLWWDVENVSFVEVLVGSSALNSMAEEYAQKAAHTLEKSNDRHQGWDDIEVIGSVTNELESPDVSFWEWLFAAMYDAPEAEVDENGLSLVKVTFADGSTSYFRLRLQHVDASDYTVEGWVVTNLRPLAAFGSDEEDEVAEYEQELLEDYQEA